MNQETRLILGSESPFRAQLMRAAGYKFEVLPANIDEKSIRHDNPQELVVALGVAKNLAVAKKFCKKEQVIIITSDHVLVRSDTNEILEKPLTNTGRRSRRMARKYLESYGQSPILGVTSLVVYSMAMNRLFKQCAVVEVHLTPFSENEIRMMLDDPLTYKGAGALSNAVEANPASDIIQSHIKKIVGDESVLIGLPMKQLKQNLSALGYS